MTRSIVYQSIQPRTPKAKAAGARLFVGTRIEIPSRYVRFLFTLAAQRITFRILFATRGSLLGQ